MIISILTLFPDMYSAFLGTSLIARAQEQGIVSFDVMNMFTFCEPKERIDGPTFGHGSGMVLRPEVYERAITAREAAHGNAFKIFFSPRGKKLDQAALQALAKKIQGKEHVMLLPARYEGMDARIEQTYADEILSIGDYVLMGGDLPAMVFLEGMLRLLPGVVGKQESVEHDSFTGPLVDYPEYTAPVEWQGLQVPEVLRSGNHRLMQEWREQQAIEQTVFGHFDWLRSHETTEPQNKKIMATIPSHYVALMHDEVLLPDGRVGTTSVTSLDIHDIARSAKTYGLKGYFLVTPLEDQKKITTKLLTFWKEGVGITYNPHRHEAVNQVEIQDSLAQVIQKITELEGAAPVVVTTSAQDVPGVCTVTYYDQSTVWQTKRPVLLVLGTGRGLAPQVFDKAHYNLVPLKGYTPYNHLSVRSAAAVIFDRWLGINIRSVSHDKK